MHNIRTVKPVGEPILDIKVTVLILGILMLLVGFIVLLFLAHSIPTLVNFSAFAFIIGILVTTGSLVEIATDKKSLQLSKKRIIGIALIVIAIGLAVPYSAWIVVVPNWSFSVTTDKSTYELGEPVQIRVMLENLGFISHSFTCAISDPVFFSILRDDYGHVWYSKYYDKTATYFTVSSHQTLERTFTWNQTNIYQPEKELELGTYTIKAFIPRPQADFSLEVERDPLFYARTSINITSS
jgi:hypothetical protein